MLVRVFYVVHQKAELFFGDDCDDSGRSTGKERSGIYRMVYFFAYGIGQLCNGILGDRVHPGKMIFTGLGVAALANLFMGFVGNFVLMSLIWGINGYPGDDLAADIIRIFRDAGRR